MKLQHTAYGPLVTAIDADLNSLAIDGFALSSGFDNSSDRDPKCDVEAFLDTVNLSSQASPGIYLWVITRFDGTNYSDGNVTDGCGRKPDGIIPFNPGSTGETKRELAKEIWLPPEFFKILIQNKTGVILPAANNTIKFRKYSREQVSP